MNTPAVLTGALAGAGLMWATQAAWLRLCLSRAKHASLAGHPRTARRLARWMPAFQFDDDQAFALDGADGPLRDQRRAALARLGQTLALRSPLSLALSADTEPFVSDMQFVGTYRVPVQFKEAIRSRLRVPAFAASTRGVTMTDLDGQSCMDLTGSYGVNVLGHDFYKRCIAEGSALVADLGPVLGSYHPLVADNVRRLRAISGQDQVSFHMSGTEAVMQAVRLARYHTGRPRLVRLCGAYHGWWGDVQPGIGNPMTERDTFTLEDMSERTLAVLRQRRDIACVLVNPLQGLHPNANAPGDSALVDSGRRAGFDKQAYSLWLQRLREVCRERGIAFILDEVFVGFRVAPGGAQAWLGLDADFVTYGKTLGGGLPVGVLCGKAAWMRRFRDDRPGDICFARGTFNSHPYVMGAMNVFLRELGAPATQALYQSLDERWAARAERFNAALTSAGLPVQIAHCQSIWTVTYTQPSSYNWMLQFYLRESGLALSWVGTGRLIFSLNFSDDDMAEVLQRFVQAARNMQADGWWTAASGVTNQSIRRALLRASFSRRR